MMPNRRRRLVGTVATAFLAVAAVLAVAQPASAHNSIVSTTPAKDSTITEQPGQLVITTNDNLLDLGDAGQSNQIQVTGPGEEQLYYGTACAAVNGPALVMPLQLGEAGEYTVVWQLVSTDGHPLSGTYSFTWAPGAGQELAAGNAKPSCGTAGASTVEPSSDAATDEDAGATSASGGLSGDLWWVIGAIAIVVIAGAGVLIVTRRKPEDREADDASSIPSGGAGTDADERRP